MSTKTIGIIMNGVTGRMGYRQHLVRSIVALRDEGGVLLSDGSRVAIEPLLVGRDEERLRRIADRHGIDLVSTDLDAALADDRWSIYFDAQITSARVAAITRAIAAGKHVYTEKPTAESHADALDLARRADDAGIVNGVVHDKLYLPGLVRLRELIASGFFGRILSVRGEFGYWVFEGDWRHAQRPSWNYRAEDGGGIVVDMFPHWNYVIEHLFGRIEAVYTRAVTHIPSRVDESGVRYDATADDAAYAIIEVEGGVIVQLNSSWDVRVDRGELVEFQVDGTLGSAVVGLFGAKIQPRDGTPTPTWNPDLPDAHDYAADWLAVPTVPPGTEPVNGFRAQWEEFIRDVLAGRPHAYDFASGARGLLLAERALESSGTGRRLALVGGEGA
ncbi:putative dehydrogenase [Labedella gwakjiensis]|uniref:Gfo/Idh/MocA family oxidoreductase n=1 Tax=Labedella gwakjiensis TaxID=390269 RepID=A0A2P8GUI4_9MICO|nr:Gfo/Idh/MocA family oxidoreductase [Labedella gwakjiensis]PSL37611.1 putative dehydrogenase [Labedella gwakjiensis]RUQ81704.1 Gfo/Idh/MocA family oxidoreductase [Labedella gwakjiensis]